MYILVSYPAVLSTAEQDLLDPKRYSGHFKATHVFNEINKNAAVSTQAVSVARQIVQKLKYIGETAGN